MPQTVSAPPFSDDDYESKIDWLSLLHELWAARVRLMAIPALIGVTAALATITFGKFESEGFYQLQMPSLKTADVGTGLFFGVPSFMEYKLIASLLAEPE